MIGIIDYGIGNRESIKNMLRRLGIDCMITSKLEEMQQCKKLILPGVGHWNAGMANLHERGLVDGLHHLVVEKQTPILGICLGMQMLFGSSEEGNAPGLGWIKGEVKKFMPKDPSFRVPHMGWNEVITSPEDVLIPNEKQRFYFVHSYFVSGVEKEEIAGTTLFEQPFTSYVRKGHIMGVQFHPEKSHQFGMEFFMRFDQV